MSDRTCGSCGNFQPKGEEKFFNCTSAKQAGIRYGMQVRADTGACEAFTPNSPRSAPTPPLSTERVEPDIQSCGRTILKIALLLAIIVIIAMLSWLLYSCATEPCAVPATTPTPESGNTSTPTNQPPSILGSPYIIKNFNIDSFEEETRNDREKM